MSETMERVQSHYGRGGIMDRIIVALRKAGIDPQRPRCEDLYPLDQLHGLGIAATSDHAERAGLRAGMHVLDLGCGIGGCSRYLAAERGCRVTGVDLTAEYIDIARELTRRCGFGGRILFRRADALALPFPDATFDHVWCHNVTMNIPDKRAFAAEVARVLKHGGRFSCVELAQGPAGAPAFPMPWAADAAASFLATPEEMRAALVAAGLRILDYADLTAATLAQIKEIAALLARGEPNPLRNGIVLGDDIVARARNSAAALAEGRLIDEFILAERPDA
jgi:ubiquinone/menaquinone biosynthesis C-methylase UbiE